MAFNELRKRGTAVRVSVTDGDGKDASRFIYAAAARGADGSVAAMLANYASKEKPFVIDFARAASSPRCRIIDDAHTWKDVPLPSALPPCSVLLVEIP